MKKLITLLVTPLLFAALGLTSAAGTAVPANPISAPPLAPQEKPLDQAAADALVAELKEGLADLIEDEDSVAAITAKWGAHNLAGKTRTQILNLLFADVKSVVKEQETLDSVWEDWKEVGLNEEEANDHAPVEAPKAPAPAPAAAPPLVIDPGTCSPRKASLFVQPNQAERFGLVRVGYRLWFATGTVLCFNAEKRYGYITSDDGSEAIFVYVTSINMVGVRSLQEGQKVQYEIQTTSKGQRAAVNVRAA